MSIYDSIIRPALFRLPAETVHEMGIEALKLGLAHRFLADNATEEPFFSEIERFGLRFANPVGIAAGFDKNGVVVNELMLLGFGFVEVGTVTYEPQPGNPKPRLFRLPEDNALINRLGFNNVGASKVSERLKSLERRGVVGVNIGKNKDVTNDDATENYIKSFDLVYPVADYIAVNISSPNTPNLRELQRAESLEDLLTALQERNKVLSNAGANANIAENRPPGDKFPNGDPDMPRPSVKPVLVKIAPDLTDLEIESIVDIAVRHNLAGIIATNTTISRAVLQTKGPVTLEAGGLSGQPLRKRSTEVVSAIYRYSHGKMPIIGVGGIFNAEDAFEKIAAGASMIQAYTGFVYAGPSFARNINSGLARILKERGFDTIDDAVGSSVLG